MYPAVILFIYNRSGHAIRTFRALNNNIDAYKLDLYIFSDGPKNDDDYIKVNDARLAIKKLIINSRFKSTVLKQSEVNKGLANSVIEAVSALVDEYQSVIVLEDDLIVSKHFLSYMVNALEFYKEQEDIWSISGYTPNFRHREEMEKDVYFHYRGCSWGWATWSNRWKKVDWYVKDYMRFIFNNKARKAFDKGSEGMSFMLDRYMRHEIDSWAIRWCYAESKENMVTVYPKYNMVKNIGLDGSGIHSEEYDNLKFGNEINDEYIISFVPFERVDNHIISSFNNTYMQPIKGIAKIRHTVSSIYKRILYCLNNIFE